jgi:hypothetical protein
MVTAPDPFTPNILLSVYRAKIYRHLDFNNGDKVFYRCWGNLGKERVWMKNEIRGSSLQRYED